MADGRNRAALVAGVFFVVAGIVFLLDRLEVFDLRVRVLWPLLLILLGISILVGGKRSTR